MKFMKWEDLKFGDKLKFNPEFLRAFKIKFGRLPKFMFNNGNPVKFYKDPIMTFGSCYMYGDMLRILTNEIPEIEISKNTGGLWSMIDGPPVFEIIQLNEE